MYERMERAFEALEELVDEGKIGCYGVSTNTRGCRWSCTGQRNELEATDLGRMAEAATKAATRRGKAVHSFKIVQIPLNLLELNAATDQAEEGQTTIQRAKSLGVDVMVNRPLNAIPPPGFHTGDWSRASSYITLRDILPLPPSLALLRLLAAEALSSTDVPKIQPLSRAALHVAMSVPGVGVALSGARDEAYVQEAASLLQEGPVSPEAVGRVLASVPRMLKEMEAEAN